MRSYKFVWGIIICWLISVTAGTRMRRYVPASRGRALPFEKVSSNIFVEVAGEEKAKKAAAPKADAKAEKKETK